MAALEKTPNDAYLWNTLGDTFAMMNKPLEAVNCYSQAIKIDDKYLYGYTRLFEITKNNKEYRQTLAHFQTILASDENNLTACLFLGITAANEENFPEAIKHYTKAVELAPHYAVLHDELAFIYFHNIIDRDKAEYHLQKSLALKPNRELPLRLLSELLHIRGNLLEAFKLHEQTRHFYVRREYNIAMYNFFQSIPRWQGENFAGKRLIIGDHEGFIGYGDIFQFSRYLPLVKERGGQVIFPVPKGVLRLFEDFGAVDEVLPYQEEAIFSRTFDLSVPLIALPAIFNISLTNIPNKVPYLPVCPKLNESWKKRLNNDSKMKVGLVWGGSMPVAPRNCELKKLAVLGRIRPISYYSLQIGPAAQEIPAIGSEMKLIDLTGYIEDFADTAALINNLDLVISVDTGVAHLAGALGKPVWLMLKYAPECRWLLDRNDSPWYPTMRIFRLNQQGSWEDLINEIYLELDNIVKSGSGGSVGNC